MIQALADISPEMKALSGQMSKAGARRLRKAVAAKVRMHVLDTFAAMVSGSRLLPGRRAIAHAGSLATTMSASGFTGVDDLYSGARNFLGAYSPNPRTGGLTDGLDGVVRLRPLLATRNEAA